MIKIEKHLVLYKYILSLFGVSEFEELQKELSEINTFIQSDGTTSFYKRIVTLPGIKTDKIQEENLLRYDKNIIYYTQKISFGRDKVSLKYFQYLAILFSEIIFDNLKNRRKEFLDELNAFLSQYNDEQILNLIDEFSEKDILKLAYWMATGSGKTLIMHVNYYQFIKYKLFEPDNIILITPNEGLSKQHFEEMLKSGIPCKLYGGNLSGTLNENEVLIIEITKLVEEKKGGGITIPVKTFERRNLIFVDEGHKGKSSEEQKWAILRNKLSEEGFVFEYSATFGQILSERNKETLKEYAKSIIFDYSYKYFYLDNYGKDFSVTNKPKNDISDKKFTEIMFAANLLSYYEQLLIFDQFYHEARELNLEKPLWIFVGTTVTGKQTDSDVLQIVGLINKMFTDSEWLIGIIQKILDGNTGLKDVTNTDIFENKFKYLRSIDVKADDILNKIAGGKGAFSVYEMKNADGELGIKTGENDYFGVINIGDVSGFKKELEKIKIEVKSDSIETSLFDKIKNDKSKINILIGSKKFIEGWDTWRVSCMGLLNIGKSEGPQIIQLFGRGIRIKGKNYSLKRSFINENLKILETLFIYGIKANYLDTFLDAISKEDAQFELFEIPVKANNEKIWEKLYTLGKDENKKFEEEIIIYKYDVPEYVSVNLLPQVIIHNALNREGVITQTTNSSRLGKQIPRNLINLFNWNFIMNELVEFKVIRGYLNLILNQKKLKDYLESDYYGIVVNENEFNISSKDELNNVQNMAINVLKKYLEKYYNSQAKKYESANMHYKNLAKQDPLFVFEREKGAHSYKLKVGKDKKEKIKEITKLINNISALMNEEDNKLKRIHFDKHCFLPLLIDDKDIDSFSPCALNESEIKFIKDLKEYLKINSRNYSKYEIFLLRNFPKSGTGFFNLSGFYPDFIMWIKDEAKQHIAFLDPKGLIHSKILDDEKIKLHIDIKKIQEKENNENLFLYSFIISGTKYEDLIKGRTEPPAKDEYKNNNVLFLEDDSWPEELLKKILN